MKRCLLLLALVLILTDNGPGQSPDNRIRQVENGLLPPVRIKGFTPWKLEERMRHHNVPGVSIAVFRNFEVEWAKGYGVKEGGARDSADAGRQPSPEKSGDVVDTNTLFQAGSISKPVAATVVLKLVEGGKLSLEGDVNTYLRSWKVPDNEFTASTRVTLERILSHTAGLTVHGFPGYEPGTQIPTVVQVLDGEPPANTPPVRVDAEPGTIYRYSGGGTTVAQLAVSDIEGKPFPDIARTLVLDPADMRSSTYEQPIPPVKQALAASGHRSDGSVVPGKWHIYPEMAAAGLWTTPTDLARFAIEIQRAYRGDPGRILSPAMVRRMLTPVRDEAGLGFFLNNELGDPYFQHGGADEGFRAALVAHRDSGYGAVVMVNSDNGGIMNEILRAVASVYGWEGYLPRELEPIALAQDLLSKYAGTYLVHEDEAVRLRVEGEKLIARGDYGEESRLFPLSPTEFASVESATRTKFAGAGPAGFDSLLMAGRRTTVALKQSVDVTLPRERIDRGDTVNAYAAYREIKRRNPKSPAVEEGRLNDLGYEYLYRGKLGEAIAVFRLNVEFYPDSWNVYDSLGEGYMKRGEREPAIRYYRKSVQMNPNNRGGRAALRVLGVTD